MTLVLIVVLLIILVGGLPAISPIPHNCGYYPSGGAGLVLLVLLILLLLGRI